MSSITLLYIVAAELESYDPASQWKRLRGSVEIMHKTIGGRITNNTTDDDPTL